MAEIELIKSMFRAGASGKLRTEEEFLQFHHADYEMERMGAVVAHPYYVKCARGWVGHMRWATHQTEIDTKMDYHFVQGKPGEVIFVCENVVSTNKMTGKVAKTPCLIWVYTVRDNKIASAKVLGFHEEGFTCYNV